MLDSLAEDPPRSAAAGPGACRVADSPNSLVSLFLLGVVHDLNNQHAATLCNVELALVREPLTPSAQRRLHRIQEATNSAMDLVRVLHEYAQHRGWSRHRIDLTPVLQATLSRWVEPLREQSIGIRASITPGLWALVSPVLIV